MRKSTLTFLALPTSSHLPRTSIMLFSLVLVLGSSEGGPFYFIFTSQVLANDFARNSDALSYVEGVKGAKHHSYKTWNEALLEYSCAFHGKKPGWRLEVLDGPVVPEDEDPEITRGLTFTQPSK